MLRKITLAALLASAVAMPAFAQGAACTAPAEPAAIDGSTATADQMKTAITGVRAFIAASDVYQECLMKDVAAKKAAATADKPFDPAIEQSATAAGLANQALKEKVGNGYNAAAAAYKKAHP